MTDTLRQQEMFPIEWAELVDVREIVCALRAVLSARDYAGLRMLVAIEASHDDAPRVLHTLDTEMGKYR